VQPQWCNCDSQGLTLQAILSNRIATVRQTLRRKGEETAQACANAGSRQLTEEGRTEFTALLNFKPYCFLASPLIVSPEPEVLLRITYPFP
jgi:hypothetical protein